MSVKIYHFAFVALSALMGQGKFKKLNRIEPPLIRFRSTGTDDEPGYVYDLYYADPGDPADLADLDDGMMDGLLSIHPFNEGTSPPSG